MLLRPKSLVFASLTILHQIEPFMTGDTVMERRGSDGHLKRPIRYNLWLLPPVLSTPINRQHVISERLSKYIVTCFLWPLLLNLSLFDLDIFGIERSSLLPFLLINMSPLLQPAPLV